MARDFDGVTDRIDYGDSTDWGAGPFTLSFWLYPRDISTTQAFQYFFTKERSDNVYGLLCATEANDNGKIRIFVRGSGALGTAWRESVNTLTQDVWQHVCCTWDGNMSPANTAFQIFHNGSEVTYQASNDGTTADTMTGAMTLGGRTSDNNRNLDGVIAEPARWNRVLGDGEIAALAQGFTPDHFPKGLTNYPDLIRHQRDRASGIAGSLDGTTVSDHPRVIRIKSRASAVQQAPAPTVPGLEYTLPSNLIHYTFDDNLIHYTIPDED